MNADVEVDARGLNCPLPILKAKKALNAMQSGQTLRVLATDRRLLVWFEGAWASVWYDGIRELHPDLAQHRVTMLFDDDPPYALAGPWVPYLTVVLTACLAARRGTGAVAAALGANR